jgi:hypothetical protein
VKVGILVTLFIALFLALLLYSTFHGPKYRAEICVTYQGNKACKTVEAKSEDSAIRSGTEGGCADVASGVTDTMKCVGAGPSSVKWLERPKQ